MTPQREQSADASRLTFPLQLVIMIAAAVLAASGAVWAQGSLQRAEMLGLRSDVRDIKTTMDGLTRTQGLQIDVLQREREDDRREIALLKVRLEETRTTVAEIKGFLAGNGSKGAPK